MKNNIGIILVAVLAVVLAVALIIVRQQAGEKQRTDAANLLDFSNQLAKASLKIDDLSQVNLMLNSDLATNHALLTDLTNNLAAVSATVTNLGNSLATAQTQVASQGARIADLQQQNKTLNDRATTLTEEAVELTNTINELSGQIADTRKQLATSTTNNAYLEKQLQQLIEARAELEHKFDTLADVRAQLRKLQEDIYTARRLRWIKEGTDTPLKGGELMVRMRDHNLSSGQSDNYGLHVELGTDGSVRAVPLNSAGVTNNPATNSPAR